MSGTLIVAVRKALLDGLDALPEFSGSELSLGWKWDRHDSERLFTGNATFTHEPASMKSGRTFRNETGEFDVVIHVEAPGGDCDEASTRAVELGTPFEEFVADHKNSLGVPGLNWIVVMGPGDLREVGNDRGSISQLTYHVTYDARLT